MEWKSDIQIRVESNAHYRKLYLPETYLSSAEMEAAKAGLEKLLRPVSPEEECARLFEVVE